MVKITYIKLEIKEVMGQEQKTLIKVHLLANGILVKESANGVLEVMSEEKFMKLVDLY